MMAIQFLTPLITTALYVMVYQKAGFRGLTMLLCGAPLLAAVLNYVLIRLMGIHHIGLALIAIPLSLLPLLFLAFKSWPPVAAPSHSERNVE